MPFAFAGGALAALENLTGAWRMALSSVHYLFFLPLAVGVYFLLPKTKLRRRWLLLASYYFYFFAAPKHLIVLIAGTLASWLCGLFITAGKSPAARRGRLAFSIVLLVLGLCFFKYYGALDALLSPFFQSLGLAQPAKYFNTAGALGISFYTFTALGYLIDAARSDVPAEKNILDYALFLGFFPTVTMGPIARAGSLLPQLKDDSRRFDASSAAGALLRILTGFFKKLAVADTLAIFTSAVFENLPAYSGGTLTLAAFAFAVQLYFDFAGYSDIAVGAAGLLGITVPENFKNPYFATNFSSFWQRWHISLSSWLQDYIFTPLVWSRWTEKLPGIGKRMKNPPVLTSLAVVFLVSGIWHGDTLCFLVWGALQAAYRIGEELLHRKIGKPKKNPGLGLRIGKTAVVLILWTESLVFFRTGMSAQGSVSAALSALGRQFSFVSPAQVWQDFFTAIQNGFYNDWRIAALFACFSLFCLILALWADWAQCFKLRGAPLEGGIFKLKTPVRWLVYYLLACCCFAGFIAASGGYGGSSFLYGGF